MPRIGNGPRDVEFNSVKQLMNRMHPQPGDNVMRVSADEADVPAWQRNVVWTAEEMGLLALSIIQNYPIGLVILWRNSSGVRVPIDGRQRITAIDSFFHGRVAIPDLPAVPENYRNRKYQLLPEDGNRYQLLDVRDRENFEDYRPQIVEIEGIDEQTAMDVFIKLQGGKSLTKTEIRAALGGKVCDFVTDLTSPPLATTDDDEDEDEPSSHHPFFKQVNVRNVRKAHRNLCDVLLHEHLYPGSNKHWTSLESLYRDKCTSLLDSECASFKAQLNRFQAACSVRDEDQRILLPQLKSAFLILTFFRAWQEVESGYTKPTGYIFSDVIRRFEHLRLDKKNEVPWVNFTAALSNAGYAEGRISERHDILMSFILREHPGMRPKDRRRMFTEAQKIAIWDRAGRRCEYEAEGVRCDITFGNFRVSDADHIVRWADGGETTLENGRLLCQPHNRGRGEL
ncbi:hypothetical protein NicSoilC12_14130 [Arthrobacter sp. NicSoilC12]|nr:hypothetical protein NicSoilC12_14130 [Arthrobacter sp. NicSoilC12]